MTAQELLKRIRADISENDIGISAAKSDPETLVAKYAIPALNNLKDIQSSLYADFFLDEQGWQRKIKNKVIRRIANVSRNTVELPLMRQQKFNDNVTAVLEYLFDENARLRAKIADLEGNK